jgi:hypothetical protein
VDTREYLHALQGLFGAVHAATSLAGFCYTQLTDTASETNGLLDAGRRPKLPVEVIRAVVTGRPLPHGLAGMMPDLRSAPRPVVLEAG